MGYYYWHSLLYHILYKGKPRKKTPLNGQGVTGNVNHQRVDSEILLPMATFSTCNLMESSLVGGILPPNETHGFCQTKRIWFPQSSAYFFSQLYISENQHLLWLFEIQVDRFGHCVYHINPPLQQPSSTCHIFQRPFSVDAFRSQTDVPTVHASPGTGLTRHEAAEQRPLLLRLVGHHLTMVWGYFIVLARWYNTPSPLLNRSNSPPNQKKNSKNKHLAPHVF